MVTTISDVIKHGHEELQKTFSGLKWKTFSFDKF
jgi:hypothetical protein